MDDSKDKSNFSNDDFSFEEENTSPNQPPPSQPPSNQPPPEKKETQPDQTTSANPAGDKFSGLSFGGDPQSQGNQWQKKEDNLNTQSPFTNSGKSNGNGVSYEFTNPKIESNRSTSKGLAAGLIALLVILLGFLIFGLPKLLGKKDSSEDKTKSKQSQQASPSVSQRIQNAKNKQATTGNKRYPQANNKGKKKTYCLLSQANHYISDSIEQLDQTLGSMENALESARQKTTQDIEFYKDKLDNVTKAHVEIKDFSAPYLKKDPFFRVNSSDNSCKLEDAAKYLHRWLENIKQRISHLRESLNSIQKKENPPITEESKSLSSKKTKPSTTKKKTFNKRKPHKQQRRRRKKRNVTPPPASNRAVLSKNRKSGKDKEILECYKSCVNNLSDCYAKCDEGIYVESYHLRKQESQTDNSHKGRREPYDDSGYIEEVCTCDCYESPCEADDRCDDRCDDHYVDDCGCRSSDCCNTDYCN